MECRRARRCDPRGRRAPSPRRSPDVRGSNPDFVLRSACTCFAASYDPALPEDRRPAALRGTRGTLQAAPAERPPRPGRAAPKGATVRWYDADHGLNPTAYHEQLDWLAQMLRLVAPPVKGALTGP